MTHGPIPQGLFLARLGLFRRTDRLARGQPPAKALGLIAAGLGRGQVAGTATMAERAGVPQLAASSLKAALDLDSAEAVRALVKTRWPGISEGAIGEGEA